MNRSPQTLDDLLSRVDTHGAGLLIDREVTGSDYLPDLWKTFLGRQQLELAKAEVSDQDEAGNFSVRGKLRLLRFAALPVEVSFFVGSVDGTEERVECIIRVTDPIPGWTLGGDFPDMPGYLDLSSETSAQGLKESFLKLIDFEGVSLCYSSYSFDKEAEINGRSSFQGHSTKDGVPLSAGLSFSGKIGTDDSHWSTVRDLVPGLSSKVTVWSVIHGETGTGLTLEVRAELTDASLELSDKVTLKLLAVTIESGLSEGSRNPRFGLEAVLDNPTNPLKLSVGLEVGGKKVDITGRFAPGNEFTLVDLASLLGLESAGLGGSLPTGSTAASFGDLGLRELEFDFTYSPARIAAIAFTVTTKKPWKTFEGAVELTPILSFRIDDPGESSSRTDLEIIGLWKLGSTHFETYAAPLRGDLMARMVQGDTLDAAAVLSKLLPNVDLPNIALSGMSFAGNYESGAYSILLEADELFAFPLGASQLAVSGVRFAAERTPGQGIGLTFHGAILLGPVRIAVDAERQGTGDWNLKGALALSEEVTLHDLLGDLLHEFHVGDDHSYPDTLPDEFGKFRIAALSVEYDSADAKLELLLALEMSLTLVDGFEIQDIAIQAVFDKTGLKSGSVVAKFLIGGTNVELETKKDPELGLIYSGSTGPGQEIEIGTLIGDLVNKFGTVDLPAALDELTVSNLGLSFNTEEKHFTFTCDGSLPIDDQNNIDIRLTIELKKQSNGSYQKNFDGYVTIGALRFGLVFAADSGSKTFIAAYDNSVGDSISVKELVAQVSTEVAELIPEGIELTLNEALFVKADDDILFALSTSSQLTDLPFIGGYLEGDELKLGVRVIVSKKDLVTESVQAINALLPEAISPLPEAEAGQESPIKKGLNLEAMIDLGFEPITLLAPKSGPDESPGGETPAGSGRALQPASGNEATPPAAVADSDVKWVALQRSIGPLYFSRIGLQFKEGEITFLLDASIGLASLTFSLIGLGIRSSLKAFEPHLELEGLGLSYRNGPVEISGVFLRGGDEFRGAAIITASTFSISAFGAYQQIGPDPSMFLYAVLDKPLGGPAFFFVTGLALGFGFNRNIVVPPIAKVKEFPLVAAATQTPDIDTPKIKQTLEMLRKLKNIIPTKIGAYWIAAGIRFNSFQLIDSFAMLLVRFGHDLEFVLMGVSTLQLPKSPPGVPRTVPPYLYVEMQFKVSVKPAAGVVKAEAELTENSYVIDKEATLSGGFRFYTWFDGPHKGDFVLTMGGYHPRFKLPAHYPQDVPRLGLDWPVNDDLFIKGRAYFALTPSCVMAGGSLEATYDDGTVLATFTARANFLISWDPFFYDIDLFLGVYASATLETFLGDISMSISLSAQLYIWGPEFAGIAHIDWAFISFSVSFGAAAKPAHRLLSWQEFDQAFLPPPEPETMGVKTSQRPITGISIGTGLVSETDATENEASTWVIKADEVQFSTETFIPATEIQLWAGDDDWITLHEGQEIGFRPMGSGPVVSKHKIEIVIKARLGSNDTRLDMREWQLDVREQAVPKELWHSVNDAAPPSPSADLLPGRIVGVNRLRPLPMNVSAGRSSIFELERFAFDLLARKHLPISPDATVKMIPHDDGIHDDGIKELLAKLTAFILDKKTAKADEVHPAFTLIKETAMKDDIQAHRETLLEVANLAGFGLPINGELPQLVETVEASFQAPPMVGVLGSPGQRIQTGKRAVAVDPVPLKQPFPEILVTLLASLFQNRYVSARSISDSAMGATVLPADKGAEKLTPTRAETTPAKLVGGQSLALALDPKALDTATDETITPALSIKLSGNAQGTTGAGSPPAGDSATNSEGDAVLHRQQSVRVVTLDKYGRLVKDEALAAGNQEGSATDELLHPLDRQAARVLVTRLAPPAETVQAETVQPTIGWHGSSALIQMQPRVFVGDDVLVRAQASRQRRQAGDPGLAMLSGEDIATQNLVETNNQKLDSGWIRTYLPAERGLRTLAVFIKRSELAAAERPSTLVSVRMNTGDLIKLQPRHLIRESGAEYVLIYELDNELHNRLRREAPAQTHFAVNTQAGQGWQIHGVAGIPQEARHVRARWPEHKLKPTVIQATDEPQKPMAIRVVNKEPVIAEKP